VALIPICAEALPKRKLISLSSKRLKRLAQALEEV